MDEINARRLEREEAMKEGLLQGLRQGKKEGKSDATNQIALNLISMNLSDEQIQQATGLSVEQIQKLKG